MADYYKVLGVERDATEEEIKRAYRKMSRKYHPDLAGPQFEEKFKEVNTAYEVLSDPEKRRMFDMGVDPNDPRGGARYGGGQPFGGFDMGDMFGQFFDAFGGGTGNGPIPRSQPGRDQLEELTIDLKTAVFGAEQHLKFFDLRHLPELRRHRIRTRGASHHMPHMPWVRLHTEGGAHTARPDDDLGALRNLPRSRQHLPTPLHPMSGKRSCAHRA